MVIALEVGDVRRFASAQPGASEAGRCCEGIPAVGKHAMVGGVGCEPVVEMGVEGGGGLRMLELGVCSESAGMAAGGADRVADEASERRPGR